jgi:hypothetical protein
VIRHCCCNDLFDVVVSGAPDDTARFAVLCHFISVLEKGLESTVQSVEYPVLTGVLVFDHAVRHPVQAVVEKADEGKSIFFHELRVLVLWGV